jgi:malonyl-CoA decarboxylase
MPASANLVRWLIRSKLAQSIADRGRTFMGGLSRAPIEDLCRDLVSERGEASGTAIAREIDDRYRGLKAPERLRFFQGLLRPVWLADPTEILQLAQAYHAHPGAAELAKLFSATEPRRQELFRRINSGPRGTETVVEMRKDLLALIPAHRDLAPINIDLIHLLSSWFNRGFLELRRIDWRTPALVLEKLITHEAVHEIRGWPDLRRRLERDRRCFAFFHPALPDEPLIFVEVALTHGMAPSIQPLIDLTSETDDPTRADTAVFYSINNCLEGLRNISFGAFLIKQVVQELQSELPGVKNFVTLSPMPGFRDWLTSQKAAIPKARVELMQACAKYLVERRSDGRAYDPVAAFHLSNGASIERINWMGDASEKGIRQSFGLLVNYAYRPARIERNHEQYAKQGRFAMSEEVRGLLEAPKEPLKDSGRRKD